MRQGGREQDLWFRATTCLRKAGTRWRIVHEHASVPFHMDGSYRTTLVGTDAVAAISALKQQGEGNLFVFGSADLCSTLMAAKLFDEYRIGFAPFIQGISRRLFPWGMDQRRLGLLDVRTLSTGCVILRCQPLSSG